MKKVISVLLVACMLALAIPMSVSATETTAGTATAITSASDFALINENGGSYYLTKDIVITDALTAPLINNIYKDDKNADVKGFKNPLTIDGRGYSIILENGFSFNASCGVLCYNFEGTLKNITFGSAEKPIAYTNSHSNMGIITNQTESTSVIENVTVYANMTLTKAGTKNAGLFVGKIYGTTTFKDCHAYGSITVTQGEGQKHKLGGIAGTVDRDSDRTVTFEGCTSDVVFTLPNLTADSGIGGILGVNTKSGPTINITSCANFSDIPTDKLAAVGGIIADPTKATVTIKDCVNFGDVGEYVITNSEGTRPQTFKVEGCYSMSDMYMYSGAAIKIDAPTALRFYTAIGAGYNADTIKAATGASEVKLGTLIAKTADVAAAGAFTKEALDAASKTYKLSDATEVSTYFSGTSDEVASADYATSYSAIGYIALKLGENWVYVYTDYVEADNARSVSGVAKAATEALSDTGTGKYVHATADGKYSPYTQEELTKIKAYFEEVAQ